MNWNELNSLWQKQETTAGGSPLVANIEGAFRAKQRKLARVLFWRDIREAVAGLFVAAVFGYVGYQMGRSGWPIGIAILMVLVMSAYFVRERFRARALMPAVDAPVIVYVDAEIAEQRHQRDLLMNVARWYVAPILGAAAIFSATVLTNAPVPPQAKLLAAAMTLAIYAGCAWATVALNRAAVRRVIDPRLHELESIKSSLQGAA